MKFNAKNYLDGTISLCFACLLLSACGGGGDGGDGGGSVSDSGSSGSKSTVPNVIGDTEAAASTAFSGVGLTVGTITQSPTASAPAGSVLSESPAAGTSVPSNSAVNLILAATPSSTSATESTLSVLPSSILGSGFSSTSPVPFLQGSDGNFYGSIAFGGASGKGAIYKVTPSGTATLLYSFQGLQDGEYPTSLIEGSDGNLYGTAQIGGIGLGVVFKLTLAGTESVLYTFQGPTGDGAYPNSLVEGSDGNFYGTTSNGGAYSNYGTVFQLTPSGTETVLYSFGANATNGISPDGQAPNSLLKGIDGNFYGITVGGGNSPGQGNYGTVFQMTPAGDLTVLYSFLGGPANDGQRPSVLIQGVDGNLYGITINGGSGYDPSTGSMGYGTLFEISSTGETIIYAFGATEAAYPQSLIQAADGNFYGISGSTGAPAGTVFDITPAGSETLLYAFLGTFGGAFPSSLIQGTNGSFYGIAEGALFQITP